MQPQKDTLTKLLPSYCQIPAWAFDFWAETITSLAVWLVLQEPQLSLPEVTWFTHSHSFMVAGHGLLVFAEVSFRETIESESPVSTLKHGI